MPSPVFVAVNIFGLRLSASLNQVADLGVLVISLTDRLVLKSCLSVLIVLEIFDKTSFFDIYIIPNFNLQHKNYFRVSS